MLALYRIPGVFATPTVPKSIPRSVHHHRAFGQYSYTVFWTSFLNKHDIVARQLRAMGEDQEEPRTYLVEPRAGTQSIFLHLHD
jgi:hypothetical protein